MTPMQLLARLARRARHLLRPGARERDMDDEMRAHLEFDIADRIARGAAPEDACRAALLAFGGVERFKEEGRDARGVRVLEDLVRDTAYAVRVLRKLPGFTVVSVLTIAIGIAGTTFVLTAVNTLLFRPLPVTQPRQLYVVSEAWKNGNVSTSFGQYMYPYDHYVGLRDASGAVFSGLAGFRYGTSSLRVGDEAKPLSTIVVSANYFAVLGVRPALGRFFSDTVERTDGAAPEAVIGHAMWLRDFAGRADAVGQTLFLDSRPVTIVGVAPQGFTGTMTGLVGEIWVPSSVDARGNSPARTGSPWAGFGPVTMFGRLKDGMSPRAASAALTAIAQQLPPEQGGPQVDRVRIDEMVGVPVMARGVVIGFTGVLFVTAALVLFIAAVNVAGMLFARGAYRRREIAVRLAMGAGRGRIVRQLVTESVLLCTLGGAVGLMLERWLSTLVQSFQPPIGLTTELDLPLNVPVLALTFLATLAAGVLSGLTPALRSTRVDVIGSLRGVEERGTRGLARSRIVIAQLATSLVLLVTAGLFGRALSRALGADPGLDASGVASAELDVESHGYDRARGEAFYAELIRRLAARPDIASASLGLRTPLAWAHDGEGVYLPGEQPPSGKRVGVGRATIDPNYLGTVKIPVILGRNFSDQDTRESAPVVIVNESVAKRFWPGESPIGQEFRFAGVRRVVGVVRDGKYRSLDEPPTPFAFVPFSQRYSAQMTVFARSRNPGDAGAALAAIRAEVKALQPNMALVRAMTLTQQLDIYAVPQRFAAWSIGAFGLVGLGLAMLGIYGVVGYYVAQRTREFGIRMALGASARDVRGGVLRRALVVIAVGIGAGVPVAMAVGRLTAGFLYGISPADPLTYGAVALLLGLAAVAASYVPAHRASRADPLAALRSD